MYGIKLQLPSNGAYGVNTVGVKRLNVKDLLDYFQSDNSIFAKNELIKNICDTDLTDYPVGDREFVFSQLRSLINSNVINGTFSCENEECNSVVVYIVDLGQVKVNILPSDFRKDYEYKFPICGETKKLNVLTVRSEKLMLDYLSMYEVSETELPHSDLGANLSEFARYACMLGNPKDKVDVDENITFLRELDWADFEQLLMYDVSFECGPEITANAVCDNCKEKYKVRIKTDNTFFGLTLEGLISKHRFLAKAANIGFQDFMDYSVPILDNVVTSELNRIKEQNAKIKSAKNKR